MMYECLGDVIGNTPLVKVDFKTPGSLYAKLEYLNPGGSVKDRSSLFMIEEAERTGALKPGGTIIDASSGNQGIAIAMIGAAKGYKVIITVPKKISQEKLKTIQAYGATVIVCPLAANLEDPESYHSAAVELHKKTPNSFMPNQYFNPANTQAHYRSLGPEIWKQTNGTITHLFAGAGTGGTISGAGKYLKEQNPKIKIIGIDSDLSYRATNGNPKPYNIEGIGIDFRNSPVLKEDVIDEIINVSEKNAYSMLKPMASQQGLLAGMSSGAVAYVTQNYANNYFKNNDLGIMIFGDSGRAYLTKNLY